MDTKLTFHLPYLPGRNLKHADQRYGKYRALRREDNFQCNYCHAMVHSLSILSGVQNRNHCPYCLHSRHLDLAQPGDRLSACKGSMQPIGLTVKPGRNKYASAKMGELMLVHHCIDCGTVSLNRIAADDSPDGLFCVLKCSLELDQAILQQLGFLEVHLLSAGDLEFVSWQLYGNN